MEPEKHCPTCFCNHAVTTVPMFDGAVQTGIAILTPNAEGYESRVYDMPPGPPGVLVSTRIEDMHLRSAGQFDHDGNLITMLPV